VILLIHVAMSDVCRASKLLPAIDALENLHSKKMSSG